MIVTDEVHLKELVEQVLDVGEFAFDVETIGTDGPTGADIRLHTRRNSVVWIGFATRGLSFTVPLGHPHGEQRGTKKEPRVGSDGRTRNFTVPDWAPAPQQLRPAEAFSILEPLFFEPDILKIGHNVKFDVESCLKYYDDDIPPGPYFDTQIAAHTLNENLHNYKLGPVVEREFGFKYDKKIGEQVERYGFRAAGRYNLLDCRYTWLLKKKYEPLIGEQGLEGLWALEMDVLEVLLRMERTGALLDVEAAEKLYAELTIQLNRIKGELFRLAGGREINFKSTPQMGKLLFGTKKEGGFGLKSKKRTKGGQPSVAKEALELLQHPFVDKYLELQEVDKIHGTYLKAYLGGETEKTKGKNRVIEVKPSILVDGKLHANFKQHGTVTGRFSCSEPNLQNIPRPDEDKPIAKQIRGLFIAPPGHSLIVADYGQIEYIVMAHFSRDPMLVRAFAEGVDLHQYVAAMVFGKDMEDITKTERTTAKNTNFAVAYGAGDDKVAAMSKISLDQAVTFRKKHRKMLPKLYKWTEREIESARRRRPPHVTTLLGRKRRLPTLMSTNWYQRSEAERQAVNTRVQGSAADIIKLAMVRYDAMADEEMPLSLSVHDELVAVVPDDRVDDGCEVMREAMLGPGIQSLLTVEMKIDMQVVKRWSEAKG